MTEDVENLTVQRITPEGKEDIEEVVTRELPLTIILNDRELVTLLCSPKDLDYLAVGFLYSEGMVNDRNEVKSVLVDDKRGVVRVEVSGDNLDTGEQVFKRLITSGCGRGASFYTSSDVQQAGVESNVTVTAREVLALMKDFQHRSELFRATGGVHSAALCDNKNIIVFNEDIGRHNAIDKIFGQCLLKDIPTRDRFIVTSGRISSEILLKVAKRNIPVLISKSAPTNLGVGLANNLGVTLIGFVRGQRMNVYTHPGRVALDDRTQS